MTTLNVVRSPERVTPTPYRLTVAQYHQMIRDGVLAEDDPVELVEGMLVTKMPHGPLHDACVSIVARELRKIESDKWMVRVQSAVTLDDSEPEPDIAIALGPEERYFEAHPNAADLALVIEVADSSLRFDQTEKKSAYARNGVSNYWIVNLVERRVEVYSKATSGPGADYQSVQTYQADDFVPVDLGGDASGKLSVSQILPKASARK